MNETSVLNSHRQPLHRKAKGRLKRRLPPRAVIPMFSGHVDGISARCCTRPEHPLKCTRSHTHTTGHRSKGLGQHWSQALSLSKAWEHHAPKPVPAPMFTCKQPRCWANLNSRTGSDTRLAHGLDKS